MPLPFILGIGAAAAGAVGVGKSVSKMKEANEKMREVNSRHSRNRQQLAKEQEETRLVLDELGVLEVDILNRFEYFAELFEQIHNKPKFVPYNKGGIEIPTCEIDTIRDAYMGARELRKALGGAAAGSAGTMAVIGAGSMIGATTAGVALGTTVFSAVVLGPGILVGSAILSATASSLSDEVEAARTEMLRVEEQILPICDYLKTLRETVLKYKGALETVNRIYKDHYNRLYKTIRQDKKTNWEEFTDREKLCTENSVLLVGLLYKMCKTSLVFEVEDEHGLKKINDWGVNDRIKTMNHFFAENRLGM